MAKTSAYQLQKTDVRVNSICPGLIETGMTGETFEYARQRGTAGKIGQLNPLGRFGVAEGIVAVLVTMVFVINQCQCPVFQKLRKQQCFWRQVIQGLSFS